MSAESKIKIYKGDPTAGDDDGMLITALSPLIIGQDQGAADRLHRKRMDQARRAVRRRLPDC